MWYVAEPICDRLLISQQHESRRGRPIFPSLPSPNMLNDRGNSSPSPWTTSSDSMRREFCIFMQNSRRIESFNRKHIIKFQVVSLKAKFVYNLSKLYMCESTPCGLIIAILGTFLCAGCLMVSSVSRQWWRQLDIIICPRAELLTIGAMSLYKMTYKISGFTNDEKLMKHLTSAT